MNQRHHDSDSPLVWVLLFAIIAVVIGALLGGCMETPRPEVNLVGDCLKSGGEVLTYPTSTTGTSVTCVWVRPGGPTWDARYYELEAM